MISNNKVMELKRKGLSEVNELIYELRNTLELLEQRRIKMLEEYDKLEKDIYNG